MTQCGLSKADTSLNELLRESSHSVRSPVFACIFSIAPSYLTIEAMIKPRFVEVFPHDCSIRIAHD